MGLHQPCVRPKLQLPLFDGGFCINAMKLSLTATPWSTSTQLRCMQPSLSVATHCHDSLPHVHPSLRPSSQLHIVPTNSLTAPGPSSCASLWRSPSTAILPCTLLSSLLHLLTPRSSPGGGHCHLPGPCRRTHPLASTHSSDDERLSWIIKHSIFRG
jgi:hypothetical protein